MEATDTVKRRSSSTAVTVSGRYSYSVVCTIVIGWRGCLGRKVLWELVLLLKASSQPNSVAFCLY